MKAHITILGRLTGPNKYAVLTEKLYYPDIVYVFTEDIYADRFEQRIRV